MRFDFKRRKPFEFADDCYVNEVNELLQAYLIPELCDIITEYYISYKSISIGHNSLATGAEIIAIGCCGYCGRQHGSGNCSSDNRLTSIINVAVKIIVSFVLVRCILFSNHSR